MSDCKHTYGTTERGGVLRCDRCGDVVSGLVEPANCASIAVEAIRDKARGKMSWASERYRLRYEDEAFAAAAEAVELWEFAKRVEAMPTKEKGEA